MQSIDNATWLNQLHKAIVDFSMVYADEDEFNIVHSCSRNI